MTDVQGPPAGADHRAPLADQGEADQGAQASDEGRRTSLVASIKKDTPTLWGPGSTEPLARIADDHDELCELMVASIDTAPADAIAIAEGLIRFWTITGRRPEGRAWYERAASLASDPVQQIRFGLYAGQLARDDGDPKAPAILEELIAAARELVHPATVGLGLALLAPAPFQAGRIAEAKQMASEALTLLRIGGPVRNVVEVMNLLGNIAMVEGDVPAAFAAYEDALAISREAGMHDLICRVLVNLGSLSLSRSDLVRAREYYTEARQLAEPLADATVGSAALVNLGVIATLDRDYVRARTLLDQALAAKRELGDVRGTAIVLHGLADLDRFEGRFDAAEQLIRESLQMFRTLGFSIGMISGLETFAAVLAHAGDAANGLRTAAAADAARAATGQRRSPSDTADFDATVAALRDRAGTDAQTWWDEGFVLSLHDAVDRVLAAS